MSIHTHHSVKVSTGLACCMLLAAGIALIAAQPAQAVTSMEQIDRLGEVYGALLDFRPAAIPGPRPAGQVEISGVLDLVPNIDNRIGGKTEPATTPPAFGRARIDWSTATGIRLGGFIIPPVTVAGNTAHLYGLEAEYGWGDDALRSSARVHATRGQVSGPFSASDASDRFELDAAGFDVRSGWFSGAWVIYAGLGSGGNQARFTLSADGAVIDTKHHVDYALAGIGWRDGAWTLLMEQEHTFSYLSNLIISVTYGF